VKVQCLIGFLGFPFYVGLIDVLKSK
jgi:hypothetical protein